MTSEWVEQAATAIPTTTSNYRVVGKLLSPGNTKSWLGDKPIKVKGKW